MSSIEDARNKVRTSNFFALCYLMLCQLSYLGEDKRQVALDLIRTELPNMPVPEGTVRGKWRLGWGPEASDDNSNLMFAAELIDLDSKLPVFSAVVIRGTDVEAQPAGLLQQIIEDLAAEIQVPFPEGNRSAKIAKGTQDGFSKISELTDQNQTVQQYERNFLRDNSKAPVVVTGHSLGGCQTTVMALDLALQNPGSSIVPVTFAAPTAGNSAFVQLYEQQCSSCQRWFNNIDLVPMAYAGLDGIKDLWDSASAPCKRPAPLLIKIAVEGLKHLLETTNATYVQPDKNKRERPGQCQPPGTDPIAAGVQNKQVLLINQVLRKNIQRLQTKGDLRNIMGRLQNEFGRLALDLERLLHPLTDVAGFILKKASEEDITGWVQELLFQHLIMTGYWKIVESADGVASIPVPKPFLKAAAAAGTGKD